MRKALVLPPEGPAPLKETAISGMAVSDISVRSKTVGNRLKGTVSERFDQDPHIPGLQHVLRVADAAGDQIRLSGQAFRKRLVPVAEVDQIIEAGVSASRQEISRAEESGIRPRTPLSAAA